ncbi:MAG: tyrosine recombinase [Mariprofundales bacterium]|nr:tyrosine recombinase [Mariprofundales bacterium]
MPATDRKPALLLPVEAEGLLRKRAVLKGWSRQTVAAYTRDIAHFNHYLQSLTPPIELKSAEREAILSYLMNLTSSNLKRATIARRRSALSVWFHLLQSEGVRDDDPVRNLPRMRPEQRLPKAISERSVELLLAAPDTSTTIGIRDRCMLELAYASGLRVSELVNLRLEQIDQQRSLLRIIGKGERERLIPFGDSAAHWLTEWLACRPQRGGVIFPGRGGSAMGRHNFWKRVQHYAKQIGLTPPPSPHTLRHAFATHLLNHGADLRAVQQLLGHANITTTEIYTHIAQERLNQLVNTIHPLGDVAS